VEVVAGDFILRFYARLQSLKMFYNRTDVTSQHLSHRQLARHISLTEIHSRPGPSSSDNY